MLNYKFPIKKFLFLFILFLTAFSERVAFDLGPNVELVTTVMLLSTAYLGKKQSLWLTLAIMVSTDLVLGNSNIFLFTWSGFLIPAIFATRIFKKYKASGIKLLGLGTLAGISSTAFFYLWTNFGVWLLGSMYPKTISGLLMSYVNALPFLRYQAFSTLLFVPVGFALVEASISLNKKFQIEKRIAKPNKIKTASNLIENSLVH